MPQDKMQMGDEVKTELSVPPEEIKCTGCKLTIIFEDKPYMDICCLYVVDLFM